MRVHWRMVAAIVLGATTQAHAQWLYQGEESAFGGGGTHLAMTANGPSYAFGLRCKNGNLEALYMTPDTSFDKSAYEMANLTKPIFKIRIDQAPVQEFAAQLSDSDGKMVAIVDIDENLLRQVRDARKRVAVVLTLLGENYHENNFNVSNSTKAVGDLIEACQIDAE